MQRIDDDLDDIFYLSKLLISPVFLHPQEVHLLHGGVRGGGPQPGDEEHAPGDRCHDDDNDDDDDDDDR